MFETRIHPEDIARTLAMHAGFSEKEEAEVREAVNDLQCVCSNELNRDCFRYLYKALEVLASEQYEITVQEEQKRRHFKGETLNKALEGYCEYLTQNMDAEISSVSCISIL